MKRFCLMSITLIAVLQGCGESDVKSDQIQSPDSLANAEIPGVQLDESLVENFPKHWVQVVPKKDSIIYVEYCGMGHPGLNISKKDGVWQILCAYGQDSENWELVGMTANEKTVSNQTIQDGVFTVVKITYPDDQTYSVDYFWNKTTGIATFGDFFGPGESFADNANRDKFIVQKEECDF